VSSDADLHARFMALSRRLDDIERQLALVSEKVGLSFTPATSKVPTEVADLVRAGKTLHAIKAYREFSGASFEEARDVVAGL
jgi:ribosomal protein L7/L12